MRTLADATFRFVVRLFIVVFSVMITSTFVTSWWIAAVNGNVECGEYKSIATENQAYRKRYFNGIIKFDCDDTEPRFVRSSVVSSSKISVVILWRTSFIVRYFWSLRVINIMFKQRNELCEGPKSSYFVVWMIIFPPVCISANKLSEFKCWFLKTSVVAAFLQ